MCGQIATPAILEMRCVLRAPTLIIQLEIHVLIQTFETTGVRNQQEIIQPEIVPTLPQLEAIVLAQSEARAVVAVPAEAVCVPVVVVVAVAVKHLLFFQYF